MLPERGAQTTSPDWGGELDPCRRENIAATISANYYNYFTYFSLSLIPLLMKGLDVEILLFI
jgi:hypothetical protein